MFNNSVKVFISSILRLSLEFDQHYYQLQPNKAIYENKIEFLIEKKKKRNMLNVMEMLFNAHNTHIHEVHIWPATKEWFKFFPSF